MHIQEDRTRMIFKYTNNDATFYKIGLSRKDKDNNYINGYMNCKFKKGVDLENKTQIKIKDAWLDFTIKDKITNVYLFINDFDIVENDKMVYEKKDVPQNIKTEYEELDKGIHLEESDLPF